MIVAVVALACVLAACGLYLANQLARQEAVLWAIGERLKKADVFQRKLEDYLLLVLEMKPEVHYLKQVEEVRQKAINDAEIEQAIAEEAMTEQQKAAMDVVGFRVNAFRERLEEFQKGLWTAPVQPEAAHTADQTEAPE